jgi:two-component system cell cycle sensor histidine kinase/response regulator CckA
VFGRTKTGESDVELQAILDATMDVVVVLDSDRRFVSVNDAACRFYERPRELLLGVRLDELIGRERAERDWEEFLSPERIAKGMLEDVWEGEQEGSPRVLEVRSHPEFQPGRHLFVMRDITERRRLEEQLRQAQKMEAVGQLAGGVAHDFNNLLTVIGGYSEIARRRIGAGPGGAELLEVERAAERATQLTKQLLAFSRQQVLDPVPLSLADVASGLVPMLRRLIGEDIEIAMLTDSGMPPVLADRAQIEQVLVNLAVNARDAMPTGGTLTIETRAAALDAGYAEQHPGVEPGDFVCLTVTDTGIGMTSETLSRAFDPFFTTKEVGQGTGLGLATVHGIVNQSGGHIRVYSEPALGTSFKIYLPVTGAEAAGPDSDEGNELDRLAGAETILLCEDEEGVRHLIEFTLTSHGYRVVATASPHEAVERAVQHGARIDALVSDVIMPDMSGPELARRLESVRPGLRTLFVSGYTAETVRGRGRLPAGSAFLEKPFDQLSLLRAVRSLLGQPARRS